LLQPLRHFRIPKLLSWNKIAARTSLQRYASFTKHIFFEELLKLNRCRLLYSSILACHLDLILEELLVKVASFLEHLIVSFGLRYSARLHHEVFQWDALNDPIQSFLHFGVNRLLRRTLTIGNVVLVRLRLLLLYSLFRLFLHNG
jgi:hypothetical protein